MGELEIDDVIADKYRVVRLIGTGGMGAVYEAEQTALDRRVVIKVLKAELASDGKVAARFAREGRAAAKLENPHVCMVLDVGALGNGVPYLVMEYLAGQPLSRVLKGGALSAERTIDIILDVGHAVAHAHRHGIVHRDLKPDNIFIVDLPGGGTMAKVLDFGVAKVDGSAVTGVRDIVGTPNYLSPEQIMTPNDVDGRADIWALGVIMYQSLTATLPFEGPNLPAVISSILIATPPDVRTKLPLVPASLAEAIARCLTRERADRFQRVAELAEAIGNGDPRVAQIRGVEGGQPRPARAEPISAPPPEPTAESLAGTAPPTGDVHVTTQRGNRSSLLLVASLLAVAAVVGLVALSRGQRSWVGPTALPSTDGAIENLTYSADGRLLFASSGEGVDARVKVWDIAARSSPRTFHVNAARGHFSQDGAWYAGLGGDGKLAIYNVLTGTKTVELASNGALVTTPLADGRSVVAAHSDHSIRLWEGETSKTIASTKAVPSALRLSLDDRRAVVGTAAGEVLVVDVQERATPLCSVQVSDAAVVAVTLDETGSRAAAGDAAGRVSIWDVKTCTRTSELPPVDGAVARVKFARGRPRLLAAVAARVVVFDTTTNTVLRDDASDATVLTVADAPDGKHFASGSADGTIRVWPLD